MKGSSTLLRLAALSCILLSPKGSEGKSFFRRENEGRLRRHYDEASYSSGGSGSFEGSSSGGSGSFGDSSSGGSGSYGDSSSGGSGSFGDSSSGGSGSFGDSYSENQGNYGSSLSYEGSPMNGGSIYPSRNGGHGQIDGSHQSIGGSGQYDGGSMGKEDVPEGGSGQFNPNEDQIDPNLKWGLIIGGIVILLIIIAIVVIVFCCCRRYEPISTRES